MARIDVGCQTKPHAREADRDDVRGYPEAKAVDHEWLQVGGWEGIFRACRTQGHLSKDQSRSDF